MELAHRFTVPVGIEEAWAEFNDIASVAECFPGAQVTGAEGDTFSGSVKVKLGPIALVYNGSGTFTEKDDVAHRFLVDAKGKDKRGNGTAGAKVTLSMTSAGESSTDVEVLTDLAITGKPAQFGRGVMQDVSDKLLGQFVNCLEQRMGPTAEPATPVAAEPTPQATGTDPSVAPVEGTAGVASASPPPPATAPPAARPAAPRSEPEALDFGATVLPVLLKSYWKQLAAGVVVIVVVIRLITR